MFEQKTVQSYYCKILLFVLMSSISILFLTGCTKSSQNNSEKLATNEIVDMSGRKVTLPDEIKTIATPNVDAYRILVQIGAADKLVGVPSNMYGSKFSKDETIEVLAWPKVKELEKVGGGPPGTEINSESLISLKPDIIVSWSFGKDGKSKDIADKLQEETKIPVVCINNINAGKTSIKGIEKSYTIMGKISGKSKEAKELISYYKDNVKEIEKRITESKSDEKTAYMCGPNSIFRKSNNYLPISQLHLKNVAVTPNSESQEVSKEQLAEWNPDFIFMHTPAKNFRINMNDIKSDPVLKDLNSIKNKNIYHIKAYYMGWDIATGLVDLNYMAKIIYPELFKDIDMNKKGNEILETFYHKKGLYKVLEENSSLYKFD